MKLSRTILAPLLLTLVPATGLAAFAQEDAPAASAETPAVAASVAPLPGRSTSTSYDLRSELSTLLRESPSELATILALDPTLLSNEGFLSGYPKLASFVAQHSEVRRNPRFYLAEFETHEGAFGSVAEPVLIFLSFTVIAIATAWLIRTLIEQRRWSRLSRTQSEVHNKILERFGSSEALLEYMRSPAGSKFLESAPIPLRAEPPVTNAPIARALLSIQVGVIVAAGALGMLLVSGRLDRESAQGFYALGMIALCVGGGFVVSAIASLVLSRRLGLWEGPPTATDDALERTSAGR